jgi:stalled ribosome alternative rescue factor ArfA
LRRFEKSKENFKPNQIKALMFLSDLKNRGKNLKPNQIKALVFLRRFEKGKFLWYF